MVIIKIWGGIGNQLFLFSLYRAFLAQERDCKMDLSYFDYYSLHNGYELSKVFKIKEIYASREESQELANIKLDLFNRALNKILGPKTTHYIQDIYTDFGYNGTILGMDNIYLQGYFQSEKYFMHIKDVIIDELTFKNPLDDINKEIAEVLERCNSVSIHVRRGDYLNSHNGLGGVCTLQYYEKATNEIEKYVDNPMYVVFSDDIEWCKINLKLSNCIYIENNKKEHSYKDMQLMSMCKHNIIANSSFSWWGAWLNKNKSKMVIAPAKWFGDTKINDNDIVPEEWIRV